MRNKTRSLTLLLIAVLVASSAIFASAQTNTIDSIVKPSAPEFSIKLVSHPYDVPQTTKTTTTVDQYTGKVTTITDTTPGRHVENRSAEITIKNQPFTPFELSSYETCYFDMDHFVFYTVNESITVNHYFAVEIKGHFGNESDWRLDSQYYMQNGSENIIVNVNLDNYPSDAVLDFRVSSSTGYFVTYFFKVYDAIRFFGQESDWSNIQVLTIGEVGTTAVPIDQFTTPTTQTNPTPTQTVTDEPITTPTDTPNQPILQGSAPFELTWQNIAIAVLCIIVAGLMITLVFTRNKVNGKTPQF